MYFLYILIGFFVGALVIYLNLKPKLKACLKLDEEIAQENQIILQKNQDLQKELIDLQIQIVDLTSRRNEILVNLSDLEKQGEETSKKIFEKNIELANTSFEHQAEILANKFQKESQEAQQEYLKTLEELSSQISSEIQLRKEDLISLENIIADKQALVNAVVAADKRAYEMETELDFYRLNLSEEDLNEIQHLKQILPYLRDSEPLNKVIWKVYYEKPYTDLIGRIMEPGVHTGIYKITNTKNHMCYIGQAVNIAERFKQHIKRGLGAEAPTKNKLYPAMASFGVENFTFEIIEECNREQLNDREDYWQDYFHAKDFGYSIK